MNFKDGCNDFLLDCKARNLREGTLKHYTDTITQLYKYINPKEDINDVSISQLILALRQNPNLGSQSIYTYCRD